MNTSRLTPELLDSVFTEVPRHDGLLISIVGFDGSGKTTQIEALAERFRAAGRDVLETRQPTDWYRNEASVQHFHQAGGSRERARILSLFAAADRHRHVHEVILPALREGRVVLCDRYVYATFGVFIHRGVDPDFLATINRGIPRPTHAFYLDVPTAVLVRRLRERDGDNLKFEEQSEERIRSITATYGHMGSLLEHVDGARPPEVVTDDLWNRCVARQASRNDHERALRSA